MLQVAEEKQEEVALAADYFKDAVEEEIWRKIFFRIFRPSEERSFIFIPLQLFCSGTMYLAGKGAGGGHWRTGIYY